MPKPKAERDAPPTWAPQNGQAGHARCPLSGRGKVPLTLSTRGREAFPIISGFHPPMPVLKRPAQRHGGGGAGAPMSTRTRWRPIIHFVGRWRRARRNAHGNGHHHDRHHTTRQEELSCARTDRGRDCTGRHACMAGAERPSPIGRRLCRPAHGWRLLLPITMM